MDAFSFFQSRGRFFRGFAILCAVWPVLSAVVGRWLRSTWWLGDFDALLCGARTLAAGRSPYGLHPVCEGLHPATFVYAPQVGRWLAPFVEAFGNGGMRWLYAAAFFPAVVVVIWYAALKPFARLPQSARWLSLMAVPGTPVATGNVGGLLQGAIVAAILRLAEWRWLFAAVVIMAATVKPAFLTALVVLLYEPRPWTRRMASFAAAFAVGMAAVAAIWASAGPLAEDWRAAIDVAVVQRQPGRGFLAAALLFGLHPGVGLTSVYVVFAGAMVAAGAWLAESGRVDAAERALLGLGVAQLINPRLFEYDFDLYLLYPAMALAVMTVREVSHAAFVRMSWLYAAVLAGDFCVSLIGIRWLSGMPVSFFVMCGLLATAAGLHAAHRRAEIGQWLRGERLKRRLQPLQGG